MVGAQLDEHRLRLLLDVGRALISELDREALLRRVIEVARELTGARYAALGVLDQDRAELERFITSGIDEETHRAIGDLPRGRGILGELIRDPRPLRLSDISQHPRSYGFPPEHPPMTTFLGAPISIRGEVWGNLYLTEKEGTEFDESDEEALLVLAEWAAIAIENARLYESAESRRAELERAISGLEATVAIARAVGGETDLSRVLELVVKRGRALVDARSLVILLTDRDQLVVAAAAGETGEPVLGTRVSIADTAVGQVMRSGHVERLGDVSSRVRLGLGDVAADASSAMLVPLTFRAKPVGMLVALDRVTGENEFSDEDEWLMRGFASSAATAVATAQTVETEQLRRSTAAAEQERGRWARELHDETLQGLAALQVLLTSALQRASAEAVQGAAKKAVEQIAGEIEKLQGIIRDLRPAALDEIGLVVAIEGLLERTRTTQGIDIESELDLDLEAGRQPTRLEPDIEDTVYRLVQEALTNVVKHARADNVQLVLVEADGKLSIEVCDDGRGFDPAAPAAGFGLVGMRERVDLAGGSLTLESQPGAGAKVRAELPARHREKLAAAKGHPEAGTG